MQSAASRVRAKVPRWFQRHRGSKALVRRGASRISRAGLGFQATVILALRNLHDANKSPTEAGPMLAQCDYAMLSRFPWFVTKAAIAR